VGRGSLTFGADARVEFNSSSVKNYKYMKKGECCPEPKPEPKPKPIKHKAKK
jgi:hypothetical protein